jgi:lipopolysaccharide export system protein LptC
MSDVADREARAKRSWALPGGFHDHLIGLLKIVLPAAVGVLLAYLALAPMSRDKDTSFLLDKNKVEQAEERMRVRSAQYQGQDNSGRPFVINAETAVQPSSSQPIVDIETMRAQISLNEGPGRLEADRARYNMDAEQVDVLGPILFTAADGYRLQTSDVMVDLRRRQMQSRGRVEGRMPIGRFSADSMEANLPDRTVVLTGRVRLHIDQGGLR